MIEIQAPIPVFRIFDVEKAREFYLDFLEFEVDWEHRFGDAAPVYMQISRAAFRLHLSEHFGDGTPGACVFIPIAGIETLQQELLAKNYKHARPGLLDQSWGVREMHLTDPFGNKLRFAQAVER